MNFSQLVNFLKLSEAGSFSKAANELFITQQGLSHSIRSLEDELQVELVERTSRGIRLSEYGELIHPYARSLVEGYSRMLAELGNRAEENAMRLKLALPYGIFSSVPFRLLLSFREQNPDVTILDTFYPDNGFEERMLADNTDIAIANINSHLGRKEDPERFDYIKLYTNKMCVTVNRVHPLARKKEITVKDLAGQSVAVFSTQFYNDYSLIQADCRDNGVEDIRFFPCAEQSSLLRFAEENYGVAIMALSLDGSEKSVITKDVPLANPERYSYEISLLIPKYKRRTAAMNRFIQHTCGFFREIYPVSESQVSLVDQQENDSTYSDTIH